MSSATDRYAIIGHPVEHSLSPGIHAAFARQTGQRLEYTRIDAPPRGFTAALRGFLAGGGKGLSVTLPFKEQAFRLCHELTPRAKKARAINTIAVREDGTLTGDNTDGAGLIRDLRYNRHIPLHGKRVLLLGAGGAARGVLAALMEEKPSLIHIANRTAVRAEKLAERHVTQGVRGGGFDTIRGSFDLVLNATSASMSGEMPPLPRDVLSSQATCYDLFYAERPTVFMHWAEREGARHAFDGWGMLVEQAAEAFLLWRGVRPDTGELLSAHRI
jgi:shikimate dehydrogenase